jgi:uncharacterized SAM-binding protein YcdF (DUF218 family)
MWTYLFSFLLFRRLRLSKPIRYVLAVLLIGLFIVVLIYTVGLFLTLEERKSASHAATLDYF